MVAEVRAEKIRAQPRSSGRSVQFGVGIGVLLGPAERLMECWRKGCQIVVESTQLRIHGLILSRLLLTSATKCASTTLGGTMASRRLTVHLLRNVNSFNDALDARQPLPESTSTLPDSTVNGRLYYSSRPATPPAWVSLLSPLTGPLPATLRTSSASGLMVVRARDRYFALTFGFGRGMLDLSKVERNFGLRVALNRIDPGRIRSLDTKTFEDMVVSTSTQASKSSDLPAFGVDVSKDILRAVTGEPRDASFAKRLSGSNALVINTDRNITDLTALCSDLLDAYEDDAYKANFEWIDHLAIVEDPATVQSLNELMIAQLILANTADTHMAMPELINWEDIDAFKIAGTRATIYDDLDLDEYLACLGTKRDSLNIDRLKSWRVSIKYSRSNDYERKWSVYDCLVSEQRLGTTLYVLIEGRWLAVSESLAADVDSYASGLSAVSAALVSSRPGEAERVYNERLVASDPDKLLLLDAKIKRPGGATSGIELCDVLSSSGELIHVKRKSRSSTLSHLFAQGAVSAATLVGDPVFRDAMRGVISGIADDQNRQTWLDLVPPGTDQVDKTRYKVSYVVIANSTKSGADWLPFFSKLNLMQQGRLVNNLGFNVSLSRVGTGGTNV